MGTGVGELWEMVIDRDAWGAVVHGVLKESDMTEWLNWTIIFRENSQCGCISIYKLTVFQGFLRMIFH